MEIRSRFGSSQGFLQPYTMCPRRREACTQTSHEAYEPRRDRRGLGKDAHKKALKTLRARFGNTWRQCGEANQNAKKDHKDEPITEQWLRFVKHKILKRFHHLCSQLLKEIKQIKRCLD